MNYYIKILGIFFYIIASGSGAELAVNLQKETLGLLDKSISTYQNKAIDKMPDKVRAYLVSIAKPESIHDLDNRDSILWIDTYIVRGRDEDLKESIDKLISDLAFSGDKLHGDDVSSILQKAFFSSWNKEDFNLENSIRNHAIYWREHSKPTARVSPNGQNPIDWIWELEVKSREHGVIHVGIDEKKRTFICYEYPVGLYFPEGETMERIYREIVQVPDMASHYIGLGRKQTHD